MDATKLIAEAREFRDSSISRVEPPLSPLPSPLPKNVTRIANSILTSEELKITSYDAVELIQAIREKVFTCEAVTRAFLRRAALAQKLVISLPRFAPSKIKRIIMRNRQIASQNSSPKSQSPELNTSTHSQPH
jgi:amidase